MWSWNSEHVNSVHYVLCITWILFHPPVSPYCVHVGDGRVRGDARDDSLLASVALLLPRLPRFANLAGVGLVSKLANTQLSNFTIWFMENGSSRTLSIKLACCSKNCTILELILLLLPFPARKRRKPWLRWWVRRRRARRPRRSRRSAPTPSRPSGWSTFQTIPFILPHFIFKHCSELSHYYSNRCDRELSIIKQVPNSKETDTMGI